MFGRLQPPFPVRLHFNFRAYLIEFVIFHHVVLRTVSIFGQVVWEYCKAHRLLFTKTEKINLGKYQQVVYNAIRNLPFFALRGLYFTVAALKLGYDMGAGLEKKVPGHAAVVDAGAAKQSAGEGKLSLKQTGADSEKLTAVPIQNQLHKAALFFSEANNCEKAWAGASVLHNTALSHTKQAKELRSIDAVIPYELEMMTGGIDHHVRLTVAQIGLSKFYARCGIETTWQMVPNISVGDVRVAVNDDKAALVWDLVFECVLQHEVRNVVFKHGLPRRQTLLQSEDEQVVNNFIKQLHADYNNFLELSNVSAVWAEDMVKRSPFQKKSVLQLILCLEQEGWRNTDKLTPYKIRWKLFSTSR